MPPKTAPPVTEKGYVNPYAGWLTGWSVQGDPFEQILELLWPNSVRIYTRMGREDSRLASVLKAVCLPIRRTQWRIEPNGARDEVVAHVARDLGLPIVGDDQPAVAPRRTKGDFSWNEHLQQALKHLQYGHSVFERVYYLDGGRAHLLKLAPRPQSSIAFWNVARNGDLVGIEQYPAGLFSVPGSVVQVQAPTSIGQAIPAERLVVYVNDPDPGMWTGNSILRPAYKHWLLKDELMRIEAAAARRHGIGVPVAWATPEESEDKARITEYQQIMSSYTGGSSAGLGLPAEAKMQIMAPTGTPMDPRRAIEYHDHMMALVVLAHVLNLDGDGGSYALASVQGDIFVQAVQTIGNDVRDTAQCAVVDDIVNLNWGEDEPSPRLVFDEIGSQQDADAADLQMLANARLITPDDKLEARIRQRNGLPTADPDTAREMPTPGGGGGDQQALPDMPNDAGNGPADSVAASYTRRSAAKARQRREHPKSKQDALF